jgi:hypothetical protein
MALTDAELRHLTISLLTAETARDKQRRIGASNLANQCDYCLACALVGISRETPQTSRAWLGRVIGTALHALLEQRAGAAFDPANALIEHRINLGDLGTYGPVGSTLDFAIIDEGHIIDWKGATIQDILLLDDFLRMARGEDPQYGRSHKFVKLSERDYAAKLLKVEYKAVGYKNQLHLYGLGLEAEGCRVDMLSNMFIARDSTGWFDNPAATRYEDPKAVHGIYPLSFQYDRDYALAVWNRGEFIWQALEGGASVDDFERHEHCFPCGLDRQDAARSEVASIEPPAEVTLLSEAA